MRITFALAVCLAFASSPGFGQQTRVLAPGTPSPAARVTDLAWLAGEWTGEGFDSVLHETYSTPIGGQMPGHFYAAKNGKADFYEFVMIAEVGSSIEYRVRHFNPDMSAWEDKDRFVKFPLVAVEQDSWYFDGLTIRRTGPDSAEHIVRVKGKDGKADEAVLRYRRAKPTDVVARN
ncbi:MAG: DUF6265 family protein [Sphingomicrobium sp.]